MGKGEVTMFEMTGLVGKHLQEPGTRGTCV
jgi:hypothetical protein